MVRIPIEFEEFDEIKSMLTQLSSHLARMEQKMDKLYELVVLLLDKYAKVQQELAEALAKPPVGQDEIDAAAAKAAELQSKLDQFLAEEAIEDADEASKEAKIAELVSMLSPLEPPVVEPAPTEPPVEEPVVE
jgi:chromosome segregation ATPase